MDAKHRDEASAPVGKRPRSAASLKGRGKRSGENSVFGCLKLQVGTESACTVYNYKGSSKKIEHSKRGYDTSIPKRPQTRSGFRGRTTHFVHSGNLACSPNFAKMAGYINSRFGYNIVNKASKRRVRNCRYKCDIKDLLMKSVNLDSGVKNKAYLPFVLTSQVSMNSLQDPLLTRKLN